MSDTDYNLIPEESKEVLNEKQLADYRIHRKNFIEWLELWGKNPQKAEGYSEYTIKDTANRMARIERKHWEDEGYSKITQNGADRHILDLVKGDYSNSHTCNERDALNRYFNWRAHKFDEEEWSAPISLSKANDQKPQDYLTMEERKKIREAALEYGSIPHYASLSPQQRSRWKKHVAQRLRKPEEDVVPDDWKKVNGWKYTSMVWASLDAGLRPVEVGRAKVQWVDHQNGVLRIPKEESSKNRENWNVSITERTAESLKQWLEERDLYERYDDSDALWLTREGNAYSTASLRRLLHKLCEEAGIEYENRKMSWYSIRHSTGTYMTNERDLAATKAQLRHKSSQTTMKYDHAPVEDRRDALDRMG